MILVAQIGLDPTPFTAWGVLGLLGVVIIVLVGVIFKLFVRQSTTMETRDKILMEFVDRHRGETTVAMNQLGTMITQSNDKMVAAFAKQARALDEVLISNRVLDQIEKMKLRGTTLDDTVIEKVVRSVLHERASSRE